MSDLFLTTGPAHGAEPPRAVQGAFGTSLERLQTWLLPRQWTFDARNLATSPLGPQRGPIPLFSPSFCFTREDKSLRERLEKHTSFLGSFLP